MVATFANKNLLAGYMEMAIPITIGLLMAVRKGWAKTLCSFSIFFLCIALALSLSSGGWMSGVFALSFMLIVYLLKTRWLIVASFWYGIQKIMATNSRLTQGITLGSLTGIVAITVHSVVDFNLHIMANAIVFAVLAGLQ